MPVEDESSGSGLRARYPRANPRPGRAFNPLRQAHRFDPDGAYVRRYVPELAAIEGRVVHEPWKLREHATGYPTPIV